MNHQREPRSPQPRRRSLRVARPAWLIGVAASLFAAGCGNLTSGGFGELEVLVAADSVAFGATDLSVSSTGAVGGGAASVVPLPPERGRPAPLVQSQLEGTLNMRIMVFAFLRPDTWIEVTTGPREIVMPLSGGAPAILARKELPTGRYTAIRTVFLHVEAVVTSGLTDQNGQPVRGPVRVELGPDARLVVDTPLELTVEEGRPARIKVDLHAHRWIRLLNAQRQVQSSDFVGNVRVGRQP
jgi:hypothetical protein